VVAELTDLFGLIRAFWRITGFVTWIRDADGAALPGLDDHASRFCGDVLAKHKVKCEACDAEAQALAGEGDQPVVVPCHARLIDIVCPVRDAEQILGYVLCGQVRPADTDLQWHESYARKLNIDWDTYREALLALPVADSDEVDAIARLLAAFCTNITRAARTLTGHGERLIRVTEALGSALAHSQTLDLLVDEAAQVTGAHWVCLRILNDDRSLLVPCASSPPLGTRSSKPPAFKRGQGQCGTVWETGRLICCPDVSADDRYHEYISGVTAQLVLPIEFCDTVIGTLNLAWCRPGHLKPQHVEVAQPYCHLAALAVSRARLLESIQCIGEAVMPGSEDELIRLICKSAFRLTPSAELLAIWLLDPAGQELSHANLRMPGDPFEDSEPVPVTECLIGEAVLTGEPVAVSDLTRRSICRVSEVAQARGLKSFVAVPIKSGANAIGVLVAYKSSAVEFAAPERELLQTFVNHTGITIQAARHMRDLRSLATAAEDFISGVCMRDICEMALKRVHETSGADAACIWLQDADTRLPVFAGQIGFPNDSCIETVEPRENGAFQWLQQHRRPLVVLDATGHDDPPSNPRGLGLGIRAYVGFPLLMGKSFLGAVFVDYRKPLRAAPQAMEPLVILSNHTAVAISNAVRQDHTGMLLRNIGHQLRMPLINIREGVAALLRSDLVQRSGVSYATDRVPHALRDTARMVYNEVVRYMSNVDDLVNLTKTEGDALVPRPSAVNVNQVVENIAGVFRWQEEVSVPVSRHEGAVVVWTDGRLLEEILHNLLSNAVAYSTATPKTVVVRVSQEGESVLIAVSHRGIGISEAERPHIFRRGFRSKRAKQENPSGRGIGLYLSRELARLLRGDIEFLSEPDGDTTFTLKLPQGDTDDGPHSCR